MRISGDFQHKFGTRLRQMRIERGLTQAELAERLGGVKPGSVSQWETGRALPRADHLYRLARILWCSTDWLLEGDAQAQVNIEEGSGLRWYIVQPHSSDANHRRMVEDGIMLLHKLACDGLTMAQIRASAPFAGLPVARLIQLIDVVLLTRTVEIINVERDRKAEEHLKEKFKNSLHNCIVSAVDISAEPQFESRLRTEAVAFLAARDAMTLLPPQGNVGLTGSSVVSRMVDLMPPALPRLAGITWLPLLRSKLPPTAKIHYNSSNSVVARMVRRQPGTRGYRLPFVSMRQRDPDYLATATNTEREVLQHGQWILEKTRDCVAAFMSVNSSQYGYRLTDAFEGLPDLKSVLDQIAEQERSRYIGNILLYLIDKDGNRIGNATEQRANDALVYSIGLDGLREIARYGSVWILAEMAHKAPVIRAALTAGLANSLVIDTTVAQALLKT